MLREVKRPLIYFTEDRVTGCAGTGIGHAFVSSTHTTNPRQVEKKKIQDTKAIVVLKSPFINIFTPQKRYQNLSLFHANISDDFPYL